MKNRNGEEICTTSGKPIDEYTREINTKTGMQNDYIVLCPLERAKGFIRPFRKSYKHVGAKPKYPLRDLTEQELKDHSIVPYVKFEEYPESESPVTGRFWTQKQLNSGCGAITRMNDAIAETWARNPSFYGATFCSYCQEHFPVKEFVWTDDESVLGS